jgi:hypothetical protein
MRWEEEGRVAISHTDIFPSAFFRIIACQAFPINNPDEPGGGIITKILNTTRRGFQERERNSTPPRIPPNSQIKIKTQILTLIYKPKFLDSRGLE